MEKIVITKIKNWHITLNINEQEVDGEYKYTTLYAVTRDKPTLADVYNLLETENALLLITNDEVRAITDKFPEEDAKEFITKIAMGRISAYDKSSAVNSFFYGNVEFWLDRDTRVSVRSTAEIMKEMGKQTMTLWLGDVNVTLAPAQVLQMLAVLEIYALECYNTTAQHKSAVNNLATIEEVEAYDFRCGYPEKINL